MKAAELDAIRVEEPGAARHMLLDALTGDHPVARDVVAMNAGAAIYVAGVAESHEAGVHKALNVIGSGDAKAKLDEFIVFTQKLA